MWDTNAGVQLRGFIKNFMNKKIKKWMSNIKFYKNKKYILNRKKINKDSI